MQCRFKRGVNALIKRGKSMFLWFAFFSQYSNLFCVNCVKSVRALRNSFFFLFCWWNVRTIREWTKKKRLEKKLLKSWKDYLSFTMIKSNKGNCLRLNRILIVMCRKSCVSADSARKRRECYEKYANKLNTLIFVYPTHFPALIFFFFLNSFSFLIVVRSLNWHL